MLQGLITILFIIGFVVVCFWAFNPRNKKRFEDDAKLPFVKDEKKTKTNNKRHK